MRSPLQSVTSLLMSGALLLTVAGIANAQVGTMIPIPFVTTAAGVPAGVTATTCANQIPNIGKLNLGDGCPATQAVLTRIADVQVDPAGNIYIAENGSTGAGQDVRVIYEGGTVLTNILKVANSAVPGFTPIPGNIYTLAGGMTGGLALKSGTYFCGNITNGVNGMNTDGDGCPAAQTLLVPRGIALSPAGDIFVTMSSYNNSVRVIYGGGAAAAKLITLENPTVKAPQIGYIYTLTALGSGYTGDGGLASAATLAQAMRIALDSKGNVFITDYEPPGTAANYNIRRIDVNTGIITTFAGQNVCTTASSTCMVNGTLAYYSTGDGGPASAATLDPYGIFFDSADNMYITDFQGSSAGTGGRLRVVYAGGVIPGISNPVVGNIYSYAGGGSGNSNGTLAANARFSNIDAAGIDSAGNVYIEDISSHVLWKFDAKTSVGDIIAGGPTTTSVAKTNAFCSGTSGPISTDNYGDGCPGLQAFLNGGGTIAFDPSGNFYEADNTNAVLREFSYNNQFGAVSDGNSLTQTLAFETTAATVLTSESFSVQGGSTIEYVNGGAIKCALTGSIAAKTLCLYSVKFTPTHPGLRAGAIQFNTSAGAAVTEAIIGTGLGSDLAIDTGTQSTVGSGLSVAGVAADLSGNIYVADTIGNQVLSGASSGTSLTSLITGLNKPTGVAVDAAGNVYVADTGNNRILETTPAGKTISVLGADLSSPAGVAVDALGNIYVADTGNNRIVHLASSNYQYTLPLNGISDLSAPTQLTLDAEGNLYILDGKNNRIIKYSTGDVSVVAIDPGVVPVGIATDPAGTIYVADGARLEVLAYAPGAITGNVLLTDLSAPVGLAADANANLFIADKQSTGAIELRRSLGSFTFPLTNVSSGQTSTVGINVNNVGNAPLTFTQPLVTMTGSTLYSLAPSTTQGCGAGIAIVAADSCGFTASFTPTTTGTTTATVKFITNAANTSDAAATLNGTGLNLINTSTTLTYSPSLITFGTTVAFTAVVAPDTVTTVPTGTLSFQVDNLKPTQQVYSGTAIFQVPNLVFGPHTVCVTYSGDTTYGGNAVCTNLVVNKAVTNTTLNATPVNDSGQISLLLTSTVKSATANGETGSVTFYAGTMLLGTVPLIAGTTSTNDGVTTYTTILRGQSLSYPTNSLTAVYSGDDNFAGSTSVAFVSGGDFVVATASSSLAVAQGFVGYLNFTIGSLLGSSGTVTATCSGLPDNSLCRLLPQSVALGSTVQQIQVQVYTDLPNTLASNQQHVSARNGVLFCGLPFGLAIVLLRRRPKVRLCLMLFLSAGVMLGLDGCGTNSTTQVTTPGGTYTINVVFAGSGGLTATHTITFPLTVVPKS